MGGFDLDLVSACIIVAAGVLLVFDRVGLLARIGLIRPPKRAADYEAELDLADRKNRRLAGDLAAEQERRRQLEQTRSLEPVLALLERVAGGVDQTMEKLAHFNGSLAHTEQGLREATAAMRALAEIVGDRFHAH